MNGFDNFNDNPVVWFVMMDVAAGKGDFERAAAAKQELERLGVFVRFKGSLQRKYKDAAKLLANRRPVFLLESQE